MTKRTTFFEWWSWFKFNNLELGLDMTLKVYTNVAKGLIVKARRFWGLNPNVCRSYRGETGRSAFRSAPILNRINIRTIKWRCISAPRIWSHINNTVVLTILTFQHIQSLHLMYADVAWVLLSSRTQVQPQIILNPDYLPDHPSIFMTTIFLTS